jgi:GNAT superfamily N-acetyltransferase
LSAGFTIRPATPADVELVHRLIWELADYERSPESAQADLELLREHLFGERRYIEAAIAELDDGRVAGFMVWFHNYSTWEGKPGIYLEDLFVRPEYRGSGIGRALLEKLASIAVERNCSRLEWAVLKWNQPAIGFYKRLGAKAMDEWTTMRVDGEALVRLGAAGTRV